MDEAKVTSLTESVIQRKAGLEARIAETSDHPVTVVAVTKGHPREVAIAAWRAGFCDLGENYAQELAAKATFFAEHEPDAEVRWNFIGRLQSNKVRLIAQDVALYQSVDRPSLATEIAKRAPGADVLCQVDLAGRPGRGGCPPTELDSLVRFARERGLNVVGLMGVGVPDDESVTEEAFRWLASERKRLGLDELSIGMSGDLELALRCGATMVRIGSDLFGARPTVGR